MAWFGESFASIKGQISNFTKEVLTEGSEENEEFADSDELLKTKILIKNLETTCAEQKIEVEQLRRKVDEKSEVQERQLKCVAESYDKLLHCKEEENKRLREQVSTLILKAFIVCCLIALAVAAEDDGNSTKPEVASGGNARVVRQAGYMGAYPPPASPPCYKSPPSYPAPPPAYPSYSAPAPIYNPKVIYHAPAPTMTTYTIHTYGSPAPKPQGGDAAALLAAAAAAGGAGGAGGAGLGALAGALGGGLGGGLGAGLGGGLGGASMGGGAGASQYSSGPSSGWSAPPPPSPYH